MTILRGFLAAGMAAGAMITTSTLVAHSADLYGGYGGRGSIKDDHAYVAAPAGCPSTYARLDGGYTSYDRPNMTQIGIDDLVHRSIEGTGNIGYGFGLYVNCNIRTDLTIDHRFESNVKGFNANPFAPNYGSMKWGYSSTAYMANVYYDFNMRSRFSPYIGFGLGFTNNKFDHGRGVVAAGSADPLAVGNPVHVGAGIKWHATGAFMTGFVLNLHDRLKLDTGYRFLYLGAAQTGQTRETVFGGTGGKIYADNLHAHEFRVGLRYDLK